MPTADTSYTLEDQERMTQAKNYSPGGIVSSPVSWAAHYRNRMRHRQLHQLLLDREAVVALDIEPDCVARLKERFPDRANLHAFACDMTRLSFPTFPSSARIPASA